jgi:hypothetical protein
VPGAPTNLATPGFQLESQVTYDNSLRFNSSPEVMIVTIPHPFSAAHTRKEFEN